MGNPNNSRIVLLPQGLVQSEDNETFTSLLLSIGGDIERFWALPGTKSEVHRYVEYLQRSRLSRCPDISNAIVALTKTNPPPITMIPSRRQLETAFPILRAALWVAWVDMRENPFIFGDMQKLGTILEEASAAPIWLEDDKRAYLILVPDCDNISKLREHAREVVRLNTHYDEFESITSRRKALRDTDRPRPSSPASLRRPLSWTERGDGPPRDSRPIPKHQEVKPSRTATGSRLAPKPVFEGTTYRFVSEPPTGSGTKR